MLKTKLARIDLRMTPEEKENMKRKAAEAHMTVSKYILHLSQTKTIILKDDIAELTVEISRIGNNINQIAHVGNTQKFVYKAQLNDVMKHLQEIEELQRKILIAMFSDEEHTLITLEKKIEKLTKSVDSIGGRITN